MACTAAEAAPPPGAPGADSFKRLLGCSLSRETPKSADQPPGKRFAARFPGRPARDDHGSRLKCSASSDRRRPCTSGLPWSLPGPKAGRGARPEQPPAGPPPKSAGS